jgi:hypothetical protein
MRRPRVRRPCAQSLWVFSIRSPQHHSCALNVQSYAVCERRRMRRDDKFVAVARCDRAQRAALTTSGLFRVLAHENALRRARRRRHSTSHIEAFLATLTNQTLATSAAKLCSSPCAVLEFDGRTLNYHGYSALLRNRSIRAPRTCEPTPYLRDATIDATTIS